MKKLDMSVVYKELGVKEEDIVLEGGFTEDEISIFEKGGPITLEMFDKLVGFLVPEPRNIEISGNQNIAFMLPGKLTVCDKCEAKEKNELIGKIMELTKALENIVNKKK